MSITTETQRESYLITKEDISDRRRMVFSIIQHANGITAREVAQELHRLGITPTAERNFAAPRITELKDAGKIEAKRKVNCKETGRNVAVWTVKEGVWF